MTVEELKEEVYLFLVASCFFTPQEREIAGAIIKTLRCQPWITSNFLTNQVHKLITQIREYKEEYGTV